jgi:16S rRNA (guanine527-N7)-methyltransferase
VQEPAPEIIERGCREAFGVHLDPAALSRIERFLDLLVLWNQRLRLTGARDRATLVSKHVIDSVSCVPLLPTEGRALDVGTGAGFPGAVLSCVRPDVDMTLLDARQRPVSFLREVIRELPLPHTRAVAMRAEEAGTDPALARGQMLVTCRALRIDAFLSLARPLLAPGGLAVSMQTPHLEPKSAEAIAREHGFELVDLRDYRLPDGEPRRLVLAR